MIPDLVLNLNELISFPFDLPQMLLNQFFLPLLLLSRRVNFIVVVIVLDVFLLLFGKSIFVHFFSEFILLFVFDLDLVSVFRVDAFEESLNPPVGL